MGKRIAGKPVFESRSHMIVDRGRFSYFSPVRQEQLLERERGALAAEH
jgi:hypothetical protein